MGQDMRLGSTMLEGWDSEHFVTTVTYNDVQTCSDVVGCDQTDVNKQCIVLNAYLDTETYTE